MSLRMSRRMSIGMSSGMSLVVSLGSASLAGAFEAPGPGPWVSLVVSLGNHRGALSKLWNVLELVEGPWISSRKSSSRMSLSPDPSGVPRATRLVGGRGRGSAARWSGPAPEVSAGQRPGLRDLLLGVGGPAPAVVHLGLDEVVVGAVSGVGSRERPRSAVSLLPTRPSRAGRFGQRFGQVEPARRDLPVRLHGGAEGRLPPLPVAARRPRTTSPR